MNQTLLDTTRPEPRNAEVLAVEDNPGDAALLRRALSGWKREIEITVIDSGDKAITYLLSGPGADGHRPDIILLDLDLPGKTGIEILGTLKTDPRLQQIPVVILSTSTRREDIQDAYRLHANGYLNKTTDVNQFFARIRALEQFWLDAACLPSDSRCEDRSA